MLFYIARQTADREAPKIYNIARDYSFVFPFLLQHLRSAIVAFHSTPSKWQVTVTRLERV